MIRIVIVLIGSFGLAGCVVPPPYGGGGYGGGYGGGGGYGRPVYQSQRAYDLNLPSGYGYGYSPYGAANLYRYGGR